MPDMHFLQLVFGVGNAGVQHITFDPKTKVFVSSKQPPADQFSFLKLSAETETGEAISLEIPGLELLWWFNLSDAAEPQVVPPRSVFNSSRRNSGKGPVEIPIRQHKDPQKKLQPTLRLHLWIKVPNFLLPLHINASQSANNKDGHFAWLALSVMASERGLRIGRLGMAAGSDTRELFWFKKIQGWRGSPWDGRRLTERLTFSDQPPAAALGFVQPRFRLEGASESILGLSAIRSKRQRTSLDVWWESDDSRVWRLVFSRALYTTPSTRLVGSEPGLRIELTQLARPLQVSRISQMWTLRAITQGEQAIRGWWNHLLFGGKPGGFQRSFAFELLDREPHASFPFDYDLMPERDSEGAWSFSLRPHLVPWIKRRMTLLFPFVRDHQGEPLKLQAFVACSVAGDDEKITPTVRLEITPEAGNQDHQLVRLGSLDLQVANWLFPPGTFNKDQGATQVHLHLGFLAKAPGAGVIARWEIRSFQIGGQSVDPEPTNLPQERALRLPLYSAYPGGVEKNDRASELEATGAGIILRMQEPPQITGEPDMFLLIYERRDSSSGGGLQMRIVRRNPPRATVASGQTERLLYLTWRPFLVAMVRTNRLEEFTPRDNANELAFWSTRGEYAGWQGKAAAEMAELVFPPQALGEEMERLKATVGEDINPGELVDFRLSPPTILRLVLNDQLRDYAPMPWNLQSLLDRLTTHPATAGARLRSADIELLYGIGLHIAPPKTLELRVAEVFARAGWPRRILPESLGAREGWFSETAYNHVRAAWTLELETYQKRLAVYELFDTDAQDFNEEGQPAGLDLYGRGLNAPLQAYLRKNADLTTSFVPFDEMRGLRGSYAWAFESRNVYDALWRSENDPDPETPHIEATEATLARVFFSALGGWGSQQARFDQDKTTIAAHVEMGRVSELRVERIGRIGMFLNRARHVIIYRRSTLPTDQFEAAQDYHPGRPILRKAEEYVEFLEPFRRFPDKLGTKPAAPGCLCGCSCYEKVRVDSAWGEDVFAADGSPMGWKVPLRKAGVSEEVYPPLHCVCLHCQGDKKSDAPEVAGSIENAENVYFWTDTRSEVNGVRINANTDQWPLVPDIDLARFGNEDEPQGDSLKAQWGSPAIMRGAGAFTWKIRPPLREANLVSHLPQGAQIGSILRTITASRGGLLNAGMTNLGYGTLIREHIENTLTRLEQIKTELTRLPDGERTRAKEIVGGFFDSLKAGPRLTRGGANFGWPAFQNDIASVAAAFIKQRVAKNIDWANQQMSARIKDICETRFGMVAATRKFHEMIEAARQGQDQLNALVDYYIAQARLAIEELPAQLDYTIERLFRLARSLTDQRIADGKRAVTDFVAAVNTSNQEALKQARERLSAFLKPILESQDLCWRGLDLKIELQPSPEQFRRAKQIIEATLNPSDARLAELEQIFTTFQTAKVRELEAKAREAAANAAALFNDQFSALRQEMQDAAIPIPGRIAAFQSRIGSLATAMSAGLQEEIKKLGERLKAADLANLFIKANDKLNEAFGLFDKDASRELAAFLAKVENATMGELAGQFDQFIAKCRERGSLASQAIEQLVPRTTKEMEELAQLAGDAARRLGEDINSVHQQFQQLQEQVKGDFGVRLQRVMGNVPRVEGLDFQKLAGELEQGVDAVEAKLRGAIRTVGYNFADAAKVQMTRVEALVDRQRDALAGAVNHAAQEIKLKASSLVMPVKDLVDRVEAEVDRVKEVGLQKLMPDFGGLRLEKLLGNVPIDEELAERIRRSVKISHGFDPKNMTAFVQAEVDDPTTEKDGIAIGRDLTLFSFGPFECRLKEARLYAFQRTEIGATGAPRREETGRITADWQMLFQSEPLIMFKEARLESIQGEVRMDLDPKKLVMSKVLKAISDICNKFTGEDGSASGVKIDFPRSIEAFFRMNIELPPLGGGTFSLSNLWMGGHFDLIVNSEGFEIRCGLNIASREKPFTVVIFLLGGAGWFNFSTRYMVPFQDGKKPELEVALDVGIGASAGLAINLGFLRGSVLITFAVNLTVKLLRSEKKGNRNYLSFAFVLTFNGHVSVLGLISVDLMIMLAIRYESGGGMVGEGRVRLRIKICWCFTLKIDKGFTYRFGKAKSRASLNQPYNRALHARRTGQPVSFRALHAAMRRAERCVC
ncbi:MAG: hypothetical protein SFY81_08380 [Verrucomicrobiota bacterium]|nr:hypothetical protein [Verrucomicrobiota bacterium]